MLFTSLFFLLLAETKHSKRLTFAPLVFTPERIWALAVTRTSRPAI